MQGLHVELVTELILLRPRDDNAAFVFALTLLCAYYECSTAGQGHVSCCQSFADMTLKLEVWDWGIDYLFIIDNMTVSLLSAKFGLYKAMTACSLTDINL